MDARSLNLGVKAAALVITIYVLFVVLPASRSSIVGFFVLLVVIFSLLAFLGGARSPVKVPFRDLLIYVALSLALVAGLFIYAVYSSGHHRDIDSDFNSRWAVMLLSAATAFGFTIGEMRHHRRNRKFWAVVFGLLIAHFVALVQIIPAGSRLPFIAFFPISVIEYFLILLFLLFCGFSLKAPSVENPPLPRDPSLRAE